MAQTCSVPMVIIFELIAAFYRSSHSVSATRYLLVVTFDVIFDTCVEPLTGCFYTKKPSPFATASTIITGVIVYILLECTLQKDGWLTAVSKSINFLRGWLFHPPEAIYQGLGTDTQWTQ